MYGWAELKEGWWPLLNSHKAVVSSRVREGRLEPESLLPLSALSYVRSQDKSAVCTQEEGPHQNSTLLTPSSETSSLQNREKYISVVLFKQGWGGG